MGCSCVGRLLICSSSRNLMIRRLIGYCLDHCQCWPETIVVRDESTGEISDTYPSNPIDSPTAKTESKPVKSPKPPTSKPKGKAGKTHTCSDTCTSVNGGCASQSTGDCTCFAPPVSLFYWHQGDCGTRLPFKAKRDLAQQRHSHYLNATVGFASSHKATAPPGPLPDRAAQLASGLLPSPCNASYISFACSDSPDGIVHEPPQNWLGALLPKGTTKFPPVPKGFLSIHGVEEEESQVAMVSVD